jgi:hypothetical protein
MPNIWVGLDPPNICGVSITINLKVNLIITAHMQRSCSVSLGGTIAIFSEIDCSVVGAHINAWSKPPVSCSPEPPDAGVAGSRCFKKSFVPEFDFVIATCG